MQYAPTDMEGATKMGKLLFSLVALSIYFMGVAQVWAASRSTYLYINAQIVPTCTVTVPYSIDFGIQTQGANADVNGTGMVKCTCTNQVPYEISLDSGNHLNGTRQVSDGAGNFLSYWLYTDANHSREWGDSNVDGTYAAAPGLSGLSGTSTSQDYIVYGKMYNNSTASGYYTDAVTVTVWY